MRFRTKQIHAGVEPDPTTGSILTPIYQTTTYVQESVDRYLSKGYSYSRSGNPTVRALEKKLTELEAGADTACFATGMAAIHAVLLTLLNAGDHAVVSDVAYGGTYRICTKIFSRFGVDFTFADTSKPDDVRKSLRPNTRLILTETPANPTLKLTDIAAISEIARGRGIPHAVDNTFLTPYYQRPLELGADLSVHSTTKYLDGHNATVGGSVTSWSAELAEKIRFVQNACGIILSPQVAWLTLQGVKTLSIRMDAQSENALGIARFLESHGKVDRVCYPGLASHPQHDLAKRQASGFGAMVWFEVRGGLAAGKKIMDSLRLWSLAENLGSVESLVTHPVTMTHADVEEAERKRVGITDGLVRLSVGLEDEEDLIEDLKQALEKV
jgi:cystathionine gamma-lyase